MKLPALTDFARCSTPIALAVLLVVSAGCGPEGEPGQGGGAGGQQEPGGTSAPAVTPAPGASGPGKIAGVARFTGADLPALKPVEVKTDVAHCGGKAKMENRVVNAGNRGLENVVVTVSGVQGGKQATPGKVTVTNKDCAFVPHVSACVARSQIEVTNDDPINHTTHAYYLGRTFFNVPVSVNAVPIVRPLRRPGLVQIKCDVHSWMSAWVVVHENPYFAITDADGKFEIADLPPGTYKVKAWHEDLGVQESDLTVEAGKTTSVEYKFAEGASTPPVVSVGEIPGPDESLMKLPLGLDPYEVKIPADNPITDEKVLLGKTLYFDPRLSKDDTISCASCHAPDKGYSNGAAFATGVGGAVGGRGAPVVTNRLFSTLQFWDGRAATLEEQALGPIQNPIEMAMSLDDVVKKLSGIDGYGALFQKAFGTPEVTPDRIARAIATFERTVISGNSPFDRHENGDTSALTDSQKRGLALFRGKAKCSVCHTGFNLTDEKYHNVGIGMDKAEPDLGRYTQTRKDEDRGAFKTPTLRDVALSAPYFHDGSVETLEEAVEVYDRGGTPNPHLSKNIFKLELTAAEKKDLVEFLRALTGDDRTVSQAPPLPGK